MNTFEKYRPALTETNKRFRLPAVKANWHLYVAVILLLVIAVFLSFSVTKSRLDKIDQQYAYAEDVVRKSMQDRDRLIETGLKEIASVETLDEKVISQFKKDFKYQLDIKPFTKKDAFNEYNKGLENHKEIKKSLLKSKYYGMRKEDVPEYSEDAVMYRILLDEAEKAPPAKASEYLKMALSKANKVAGDANSQRYNAEQWLKQVRKAVDEKKAQKARLDERQREIDLKRQELELKRQERQIQAQGTEKPASAGEPEVVKPQPKAKPVQKPVYTQPKPKPVSRPATQPKPADNMPEW